MESGRTSSVGNDILGFDATGKVVNKPDHGNLDWVKICEESAKVWRKDTYTVQSETYHDK
jgi:hypothetical protein